MEEFLKEIYSECFYLWISEQVKQYEPIVNHTSILFQDESSRASILRYPQNIMEFIIEDIESKETLFYMHFQVANMAHCTQLFDEMMECFLENANKPKYRVLLCCSGGLTTSLFAAKMQEVSNMKKLPMQIDATGLGGLYLNAKNYDLVLLAPQIAYLHIDVQSHLKCLVAKMPTKYFATNKYIEMIDYTTNLLEAK